MTYHDTLASNDYHHLPVTDRQIRFAQHIAQMRGVDLPADVQDDRRALSSWIDAHKPTVQQGRFDAYPTSKQVAFAERIARFKRRQVPPECFRDKVMMSRWIDSNR
ncbi:hypothetical protein [Oceaniglobus ichthyenteri]|uniref:hypothetical protein n=1 Tax=Oceaniglobus ichthyenteri TaxID=2136177 RepID=UPI000D3C4DC6|nr:hypothetical protein [Oceaniglobus ichthyenteri]